MEKIIDQIHYGITLHKLPRLGHYAYGFCANRDPHCKCNHHRLSCLINRALTWRFERYYMARGKNSQKQAFNTIEFIRFELSSDDKKMLTKWVEKSREDFDTLFTDVVQSGHKINFSFNDQNDSFICSVTGKPEECINASRCYTSHGKTWLMAAWVALYKFHVIWKRGVWESVDTSEDFG